MNLMNEVCAKFRTPEGREPVVALFVFTTLDNNFLLNVPDHAGFYETSLMMHLIISSF